MHHVTRAAGRKFATTIGVDNDFDMGLLLHSAFPCTLCTQSRRRFDMRTYIAPSSCIIPKPAVHDNNQQRNNEEQVIETGKTHVGQALL